MKSRKIKAERKGDATNHEIPLMAPMVICAALLR